SLSSGRVWAGSVLGLAVTGVPIGQVLSCRLNELRVLDVPRQAIPILARQKGEVEDKLTEAILGTRRAQLFDQFEELTSSGIDHGRVSPTLGRWPTGRFSSPTTSTWISVPGASLAIRVARVTPLYRTTAPSDPRYTQDGGIPAVEAPKRAIWVWSLKG